MPDDLLEGSVISKKNVCYNATRVVQAVLDDPFQLIQTSLAFNYARYYDYCHETVRDKSGHKTSYHTNS